MAYATKTDEHIPAGTREVINKYFRAVNLTGVNPESSIRTFLSIWAKDGQLTFTGVKPFTGTFKGMNSLHVFYKNRQDIRNHLERVQTTPTAIRLEKQARGDGGITKAMVEWRRTIVKEKGVGFDVVGSHRFEFKDGKIQNLTINVQKIGLSSAIKGLSKEGLSVQDIGALSSMAWMVI